MQKQFLDNTGLTELLDELGQYLKGKLDTLTFDTTPTSGSSNPVTSGGVKTVLDKKMDIINLEEYCPTLLQELAPTMQSLTSVALSLAALAEYSSLANIKGKYCIMPSIAGNEMFKLDQFDYDSRTEEKNHTHQSVTYFNDVYYGPYSDALGTEFDNPELYSIMIVHTYYVDNNWQHTENNDYRVILQNIKLQDKLRWDTTPTANSTNPVTSDGIKTALDNISPMTEITYANLVTAKTNGTLKPGTWYRITDYITTTTQADTQSAGHNFDIIVLATSSNTLSEEARAIQHSGDTYFANSNLNAWKIWYCLENNKVIYTWADDSVDLSVVIDDSYIRYEEEDKGERFCWHSDTLSSMTWTDSETPTIGDNRYKWNPRSNKWISDGTVQNIKTLSSGTNGKGVIYRMIDEWGNDCPYDFKNIQFKRKLTDGQYDPTNGTDIWVYTFNAVLDNNIVDISNGISINILGGEGDGYISFAIKNFIGLVINNMGLILNDNVFLPFSHGISTFTFNKIEGEHNNTFAANTSCNKIGNGCTNNVFYETYDNIIGQNFHSNIIGYPGVIDDEGAYVGSCVFGNNVSNCVFPDLAYSSIGNNVYQFTLSQNQYTNFIIENNVAYVNFECTDNTIGYEKQCQNIKICMGVRGTSQTPKNIVHPTAGDTILTEYKPANSQTLYI